MKQRLQDALRHVDADYADIRFETLDSTSFMFRGKEQDNAGGGKMASGIVRACWKGGWGCVAFDSLDELEDKLAQACSCAHLVGNSRTVLADAPFVTQDFKAEMKHDFRNYSLEDKVALAERYNQIILEASPEIESSLVRYTEKFRTVHYASSRGACFTEERPFLGLLIQAIARKGELVQRGFRSIGSVDDFGEMQNREADAEKAAEEAVDLLHAKKCDGGRTTVILDPEFTGLFTHEAFGHLSEADFIYENKPIRELMHIGRRIGPDFLNIVDDGSLPNFMGSHKTDDEGTPTRRNLLVKNGILVGHLHSLETAGKMGEEPTGNARAISSCFAPIVRMTNTFIEPGNCSKEDLFRGVDDGIYACGGFAGQTMMEMFTFTATHGYKIRNGKPVELLRDVMVTGNVFETMANIDAISNDLFISKNQGGCGKGGQSPLPVSDGGPHIRIRNAVVAGAGE